MQLRPQYKLKQMVFLHQYPFGSMIQNRSWSAGSGYRFGFNGQEEDNEIKGKGNSLDFGARVYDARLGRWLISDAFEKTNPYHSPYSYANNNPIIYIDNAGNDWFYYQSKNSDKAEWTWHEGSKLSIATGVDAQGNAIMQTLTGHKAVVLFEGSRDEKLGAGQTINGAGAINAKVTVYGPKGANDVKEYTGYSMTSDAEKFTPVDEGIYKVGRRSYAGSGKLPKHHYVKNISDGSDKLRTIDGVENANEPDQKSANGEGYKTEIFIHRTNNNGFAGKTSSSGVSVGCLLLTPTDYGSFEQQLKPLGNALDKQPNSSMYTLILTRKGSDHNPIMSAPVEIDPLVERAQELNEVLEIGVKKTGVQSFDSQQDQLHPSKWRDTTGDNPDGSEPPVPDDN
jgi:RHS repeat-associated protein